MRLSAPKFIVWVIAVILGVLGIVGALLGGLPIISANAFWLVTGGFVLLTLGTALKGI
jgi:hypothetical protein